MKKRPVMFILGAVGVFCAGTFFGSMITPVLGQGGGRREIQGMRLYGIIDEAVTTRGAIGLKTGLNATYTLRVDYQGPMEIGVVAIKR
jgi:hypothetical protein